MEQRPHAHNSGRKDMLRTLKPDGVAACVCLTQQTKPYDIKLSASSNVRQGQPQHTQAQALSKDAGNPFN
jgi:hypothetical protein